MEAPGRPRPSWDLAGSSGHSSDQPGPLPLEILSHQAPILLMELSTWAAGPRPRGGSGLGAGGQAAREVTFRPGQE